MQLTVKELVQYTDEERARWEQWFSAHGAGPLRIRLAGETHATVGALVMHIFGPELRYIQRMLGESLSEYKHLPNDVQEGVFAFGRSSREKLRNFMENAKPEDWERIHEFDVKPNAFQQYHIRATTRKIVLHFLIHEIRHWAQIARAIRENGMVPPGEHDFLFSNALE